MLTDKPPRVTLKKLQKLWGCLDLRNFLEDAAIRPHLEETDDEDSGGYLVSPHGVRLLREAAIEMGRKHVAEIQLFVSKMLADVHRDPFAPPRAPFAPRRQRPVKPLSLPE